MESAAERQARRMMKQARGDFREPVIQMVALVRDKNGKPKFDGSQRQLPERVREEYRKHLTEAEYQEFFG